MKLLIQGVLRKDVQLRTFCRKQERLNMQSNSNHGEVLFKAGLFIIVTVSLLIFSILWLRYFSIKADKIVIAKFEQSSPISTGLPVYYKGVDVGKITKIGFSPDFRYTMIELAIYRHLSLPKNVYAEITVEGLTGQKYINIIYPDKPSSELLKNCDVIEGTPSDFEQMEQIVSDFVKSGKFQKTFDSINDAVANASKASEKLDSILVMLHQIIGSNRGDINKLIREAASGADNINAASYSIKNITSSPEIKSTLINMSNSSKKLDKITTDVDKITGDSKISKSISKSVYGTENIIESVGSGDLMGMIDKTLNDTDRTVNRYDCLGQGVSDLMSQRFLLMKLMFGTPGQNFKKCKDLKCY